METGADKGKRCVNLAVRHPKQLLSSLAESLWAGVEAIPDELDKARRPSLVKALHLYLQTLGQGACAEARRVETLDYVESLLGVGWRTSHGSR
jgi:hypothetical protein